MPSNDLISTEEACSLLKVTRATFIKKKKQFKLSEAARGRKLFFKKSEIVAKILSREPSHIIPKDFLITTREEIKALEIDPSGEVVDLRAISMMDSFGVIDLIGKILNQLKGGKATYLVGDDSSTTVYLKSAKFFSELRRLYPKTVFFDAELITSLPPISNSLENLFLPLKYIGSQGQERSVVADLTRFLVAHKFSNEIANYMGWALGELADNSHTHARGPCHIMVERFESGVKTLSIAVGDTGMGIPNSLKQNSKYKKLSDKEAILTAFKSKVTGWANANRGKGLSDILSIAAGNGGLLRIDSSNISILMDFRNQERQISTFSHKTARAGTRVGLLLIDNVFEKLTRNEADQIIDKFLEN